MDDLKFDFTAVHKALGTIETQVLVFENRVTMKRKISGVFTMTTKLPSETTVFFDDLSGVTFVKPTGIASAGVGWIEFSGIGRSGGTMKTVDVNGKLINSVDTANAINNPYCIVFSKEKAEMEKQYNRIRAVFEEFKAKGRNGTNIINAIQEETALDKIKKLKELLDMGVIGQEEFEAKKNDLMTKI